MTKDLLEDAVMAWARAHWQELTTTIIKKGDTAIKELYDQYQQANKLEQMQAIVLGHATAAPKQLE